jgi:hypothetical protein
MIIRSPERHGFVIIDRRAMEDTRLTYKARGLLAELLCKPDGWKVIVTDLVNRSPGGRQVVESALDELESFGYITRSGQKRSGGGRFDGADTEVRECPVDGWPLREIRNGGGSGKSALDRCGKTARGKSATSKEPLEQLAIEASSHSLAPTVVDASEFSDLRQALADACGIELSRCTKSEAGKLAAATKEILDAGGRAVDVPRAAAAYRQELPSALMTEKALANRWSRLLASGPSPASTSAAERAGLALANRGVDRAEAREELIDQFGDDLALVDEGLAAFEAQSRPRERTEPA